MSNIRSHSVLVQSFIISRRAGRCFFVIRHLLLVSTSGKTFLATNQMWHFRFFSAKTCEDVSMLKTVQLKQDPANHGRFYNSNQSECPRQPENVPGGWHWQGTGNNDYIGKRSSIFSRLLLISTWIQACFTSCSDCCKVGQRPSTLGNGYIGWNCRSKNDFIKIAL